MTGSRWFQRRSTAVVGGGLLLAMVAGSLGAPAQAAAPAGPEAAAIECPTAVPTASITAGMVGEGLTVTTGTTPQPFRVEVLGVMPDGLAAGRDLVIIKVSDLPGHDVVSQGGGIWAGMSGSPVYVNGQLLGAIGYGFTLAPSPIGGLTPAADMLDLLDLSGASAAKAERAPVKEQVTLSARLRSELGAKAEVAAPRGTLQQIPTPMGVTGLGPKRVERLQAQFDKAGRNALVYAAGRARAQAAPAARPEAGGNFAVTLSEGDVSAFAVGTTTYVCGDQALAFGHPLNRSGPARYGASDASSLTVIKDDTLGSFKMATLGGSFGVVDQDRTTGVRADLSGTAATADVTTIIKNADTGKQRTGVTRVTDQASLPGLLPSAIWANEDAVFDEWGDGTATSEWTIRGTRAGGKAFSVTRPNRWASRYDVTVDPAYDIAIAADQLLNNEFEDVTIDSVVMASTLATRYEQLHITKMEVSVNGGKYTSPKSLRVKSGAKLRVRVSLRPYRSTSTTTTTLNMTVPKSARGKSGVLLAAGGVDLAQEAGYEAEECLFFGEGCPSDGGSLNSVIKSITTMPRNDAVAARLLLESEDSDDTVTAASATKLQKLTVTGQRDISISVRR